MSNIRILIVWLVAACGFATIVTAQIAVRGEKIYTMAGDVIENGVIVIRDGRISAVGRASETNIPQGFKVIEAAVVTPGLIDAHCTVGVAGIYNTPHDQDQIERSEAIQPELRAIDAYNPQEQLVEFARGFGITTVHTGHAPGELISGQTAILKTTGNTVSEALMKEPGAIACTLGPWGLKENDKSPQSRPKMIAMLRGELIKAQEYLEKMSRPDSPTENDDDEKKKPDRSLRLETLGRVLNKEVPLLVTCNRAHDIATALRLADEFDIKIILDSAAESYLLIDQIKAAKVPVIIHPTMFRAYEDTENLSLETAAKLHKAGISVALQAGFEDYVPKTRIVLFEAAIAAANGLTFDEALATITINAAQILGIDDRVGSLEIGKDGDVACYDGDPFEYTSHCTAVIINGQVVSETEN